MRPLLLVLGLAIVACLALLVMRRSRVPANTDGKAFKERVTASVGGEKVYLAPASDSRARADAVLPDGPSENATAILGRIEVTPEPPRGAGEGDYLPNEATEWVVDLAFQGDPELDPAQVAARFDTEWRRRHGGLIIYGLDPRTKHWTFLISADGPRSVTRIQLAWPYSPSQEEPAADETTFRRRLMAVRATAATLGTATVKARVSPPEAALQAARLHDLHARLDRFATLVLQAPEGQSFEGRVVWDVMLSLGLQWGDMDCFHWSPGEGGGDDLFSVSTSTPPGYFLPEEVRAGRLRVQDLVFGFSIPRTDKPLEVFDAMSRGVEYSRKRLGGTVVDESGEPADLRTIRMEIRAVIDDLVAGGLPPGSANALQLF